MSSLVSLIVALFVFSACTETKIEQIPFNDISYYQNVDESQFAGSSEALSVVKIMARGGMGTGAFVSSQGLLVTNDHVLGTGNCFKEGCYISLDFNFQKGMVVRTERVFALPLHADLDADISVFQIYKTKKVEGARVKTDHKLQTPHFLKLSQQEPAAFVGQSVYTMGHPEGALKKVTKLKVLSTNGHDFAIQGAVVSGQSGSPVVTAEGELIGLVKTSTLRFTNLATKGLNITGGVVAIKELRPYFEQKGSLFLTKGNVQPQLTEFASKEDPYVQENWFDYQGLYRSLKEIPASVDSVDEMVRELETRCKTYVNQFADGVISFSENTKDVASSSCFRLRSFNYCKSPKAEEGQVEVKDSEEPFSEQYICASEERKRKWAGWLMTIFDIEARHNGFIYTRALRGASRLDGSISFNDEYLKKIDEIEPTLTFTELGYLLEIKMEKNEPLFYQGIDLKTPFVNYTRTPSYYLYLADIMIALAQLQQAGHDDVDLIRTMRALLKDTRISLSGRWFVEEELYYLGAL